EQEQREHEEAVLADLRARVGKGDGAATGLDAVLEALVEQRVQALLYDEGLSEPGLVCSRGDWMGTAGETCPLDGEPLLEREDIVEEAVRAAVSQSAEVLTLHDRPDLGPLGRIAATLRF
ncbi:MAG TPA: hypothetical protein VMB50_10645, partial [Myxococcales bacterium]|nr:hypothetical protein [Myxococcales bacterium]